LRCINIVRNLTQMHPIYHLMLLSNMLPSWNRVFKNSCTLQFRSIASSINTSASILINRSALVHRNVTPTYHLTATHKSRHYTTLGAAICNRSMARDSSSLKRIGNNSSLLVLRRTESTMKKRRSKMNKHKLRKRRKVMKMNTKISRE